MTVPTSFGKRFLNEALIPSAVIAGVAIVITAAYWVIRFATPLQVQVLSATLTPAIAMLAVAVAVAQWRIARNKLKLDLFDRRFAVYSAAIMCMVEAVKSEGEVSADLTLRFGQGTLTARYLFGYEFSCFLRDIGMCIHEMSSNSKKIAESENLSEEEIQKLRASTQKAGDWCAVQLDFMEWKFDKFLSLAHV